MLMRARNEAISAAYRSKREAASLPDDIDEYLLETFQLADGRLQHGVEATHFMVGWRFSW